MWENLGPVYRSHKISEVTPLIFLAVIVFLISRSIILKTEWRENAGIVNIVPLFILTINNNLFKTSTTWIQSNSVTIRTNY
jgi:dolichyl-phosphate-mannose--protein O-mannosyl transferase